MSQKGKFALGALIGMAAGVVAGVLTAPKSGKETRADIKKKADDLKDEAGVKAEAVKRRADKMATDARSTVENYKARATRAADSAKNEFKKEAKK